MIKNDVAVGMVHTDRNIKLSVRPSKEHEFNKVKSLG